MVDLLTGNELAVIEAQAIVEQQFYIGDYQFTGMVVYGVLQFGIYHIEYPLEHFHLRIREVQGLGAAVREKLIAMDLAPEIGPA